MMAMVSSEISACSRRCLRVPHDKRRDLYHAVTALQSRSEPGVPGVKFSNFLFPESRTPESDGRVIDETLREAQLTDELGYDVIWLAEHHFDGICAYVDPMSFAASLAVATQRAKIGFAVAQMSLHHPIRMAEQLSLIDHISKGRLIVGLGRGTAYNIYDYQGYGLDHHEAQARFEEAEAIMFQAWRGEKFEHHGTFWDLKVPMLRPVPYTKPHPFVIRSASSEEGMLHIARQGRPFMMNVQPNDVTQYRMDLYRRTLREIGCDEAAVVRNVDDCWVWRNVYVAETDAEAERVAVPAFEAMHELRVAMRKQVYAEQGASILPMPAPGATPPAHAALEHALIHGSPTTVAEKLAQVQAIGVGGVIIQFRLGPMTYDQVAQSLRLFMHKVVPELSR
jgi:alkanesulfonate monooxygenase SsuD/methylene tetrahydromethanopterin reductase-like flavin-dependent oxidoreductase (luciferase family)